jgi:hypothetical protein
MANINITEYNTPVAGVPIPISRSGIYPFLDAMKVGDCVKVQRPVNRKGLARGCRFRTDRNGHRYAIRTVAGEVYVWRCE